MITNLFFLLGITFLFSVTLGSVSAADWTVNPGDSIQSVIDGAAANDNITVNDNNGTPYNYTGNLVVNKNLTIKANGTVGVNAQDPLNPVFRIDSSGSGSTIQGFILKGVTRDNQAVIYLNNANYCTITGNTIIGNYYPGAPANTVNWGGILLYSSDYNLIYNNTVNNNRYGIRMDLGSNYNQIYNNNVNNGYHGMRITGSSSNNAIYSNNIMGNYQYGISQTNTANNNNTVHFNRIIANVLRGIFNEGPSIDATNNWWGPSGSSTTGTVIYSPYLVLIIQADPKTIGNGGTSTITADLTQNSNNEDTSTLGHIIDGTMVLITTDLGTIGSNSIEKPTTNGKAYATLTADEETGTAHVSAQLDGYTTPTTADVTIMSNTVYVNTATGDDSYDGEAAVYNGTHGPKKTIQAGINTVADSGTVNVADGNYTEHITINKNVNLIGQSQAGTIIDGTNNGRPITINSGTVTLTNFTIKNGNHTEGTAMGGGIYNAGNLTITGCTIQQNTANGIGTYGFGNGGGIANTGILTITSCTIQQNTVNGYGSQGGGIFNHLGILTITDCNIQENTVTGSYCYGGGISNIDGTMNLIGSTIQNNDVTGNQFSDGGGIENSGTLTINNCTIQQNTVSGPIGNGGGIRNYFGTLTLINCTLQQNTATGLIYGRGGGIFNAPGTVIITNCILKQNTANCNSQFGESNGGLIYNTDSLTITGSTIQQNTATGNNAKGGAVYTLSGTINANFNRIVENLPNAIFHQGGTFNAENNWWGSNNPTFANLITGTVDYNPWLVMTYSANPTTIQQGQTSTLSADFRYDSDKVFHDPALGHLPDGTQVTFTTNLGNVGSKSVVIRTLNGVAIATLFGDEGTGEALTSAILDSQTLNATVTITPTANAASDVSSTTKTVGMQETGIPLPMMVLAIFMVLGGLIGTKRK